MKTRIHAASGIIGFITILTFWTSTLLAELFGDIAMIASVKQLVLYGMLILIPALAAAGGSGISLGTKRKDPKTLAKRRRMPFIAANGLAILVPSAFFLASRSAEGQFDGWFYAVQALELIAGATNLSLLALNIRDGLMMTGRLKNKRKVSG